MVLACALFSKIFWGCAVMAIALTQALIIILELLEEGVESQAPLPTFAVAPSSAPPSSMSAGKVVGVVIPYVGESLPAWWDLFASSCGDESSVDFLVFIQNPRAFVSSSTTNVKTFSLGVETFAKMHASVVNRSRWRQMMDVFARDPRRLVEFKPAIGIIFANYLSNYSHWAFADLDILFGSFFSFESVRDDLDAFDIVSYSFGDQSRAYVRGQFTVHKNKDDVNNAFRYCDYFSNEDRLAATTATNRKVHYESSEGCYSLAVRKAGLRVKFEVNHFTDAEPHAPPTFIFGGEARRCLTRKWNDNACRPLVEARALERRQVPDEHERTASSRHLVGLKRGARCMPWVNPRYQPCLESGEANETIILERDGKYYRVDGDNFDSLQNDDVPNKSSIVETRAFFHFQEWKKRFRSFSAWIHPHESFSIEEFSLPQFLALAKEEEVLFKGSTEPQGLNVLATQQGFVPIPSIRPREPWHHARLGRDVKYAVPLRVDPARCAFHSCSPSVEKHFKSTEMTAICGDRENLFRDRKPGVALAIAAHNVTPTVAANARAWGRDGGGPVVIALSTTTVASNVTWCKRLQQPFDGNSSFVVVLGMDGAPLKALLNVATDLAPTRFVLPLFGSQRLCPSCYAAIADEVYSGAITGVQKIGRGPSASRFAAARVERGTIIVLPEFTEDGRTPATRCGSKEPALTDQAYRAWSVLRGIPVGADILRQERSALSIHEAAPVVVIDNLDHRGDRRLVRYLEELGDVGCYDGAFVRSLKLHHTAEHTLRLARRAFITTSISDQRDEMCGCPNWEKAKSAIRAYASFLDDANQLKVLADREIELRQGAAPPYDHRRLRNGGTGGNALLQL